MKQHRGRRARVAHIAVVLLGLVLAIVGLSSASANADPPGNNGTVKIDGTDLNDGPGHTQKPNDPCALMLGATSSHTSETDIGNDAYVCQSRW